MGIFGKKPQIERPLLVNRTVKFSTGELVSHIWSSAGEWSKNQNPSHVSAILAILKKNSVRDFTSTAYLIPDAKRGRIAVEMDGKVIDQLTPESQASVADRVTEVVPVKCRIQVIGKDSYQRCNVTVYHTR